MSTNALPREPRTGPQVRPAGRRTGLLVGVAGWGDSTLILSPVCRLLGAPTMCQALPSSVRFAFLPEWPAALLLAPARPPLVLSPS